MRRCWPLLLCLLLVMPVFVARGAAEPALPARAYLLMDATTGQVLHEHDGETELPIASTTKIMTAILALEKGNLSDVVTAGRKPYDTGGTTMYLEIGEQQTLENLLYALMMESANDAAVAIAEHLGGTEEQFVAQMNAKARAIGAVHTHFANSHGLHDPNHYSTARDLALIARYALQNPEFRRIITTEAKEIPGAGQNPPRKLYNHNRLLGYYEGADGVKNGFTEEAGLTNVASARRGETELIAVVLGAQDRVWTSSMALLDFGFSHFRTARVVQRGEQVAMAAVSGAGPVGAVAAADLAVSLRLADAEPKRQIEWLSGVQAPVPAGGRLGKLKVVAQGQVLGEVGLVAARAVPTPLPLNSPAAPARPVPRAAPLALPGALVLLLGGPALITVSLNQARRLAMRLRHR